MTTAQNRPFTAQIVTVSSRCAAGTQEDRSGLLARRRLEAMGLAVAGVAIIPDDRLRIAQLALQYCDVEPVSLLLFTGGTGPTPDDLTPPTLLALLDRRYEGIEAAIHADGRAKIARAPLSRVVAGVRGQTVVIALSGSPGGVDDALTTLAPILTHLLALTRGQVDAH